MKKSFITLLLLFVLVLTGCGETSYLENTRDTQPQKTESDAGTKKKESSETVSDDIYVQVEGAVRSPGVYRLKADSRVFSLIEKAGGFTKDAFSSDINQAELLTDGQKITVLTKKEAKKAAETEAPKTSAGGTAESTKVDINTADESALTTIPGIGPSKARSIIAYREENGPFKKTEDITNVSGIGDATFQKIKDSITV